jgi:hypothetical protein
MVLCFAAQTESNFAGYSSEDLVGRVNHKPLVHHVSGFCAGCCHEISLLKKVCRALFCGRRSSDENLLGSFKQRLRRRLALQASDYMKNRQP